MAFYSSPAIGPGPAAPARAAIACRATSASAAKGVYEITDARYHEDYRPDGIMVAGRAYRFLRRRPAHHARRHQHRLPVRAGFRCPTPSTKNRSRALGTLSRQVINRFELNARVRHMERDRGMRTRVEQALTVERNFVSTVLDTVGALVAVFDTAGRIVRFNRACEQVSGYGFGLLVGRLLWEKLIPESDIAEAIESFERLRSGKFPASFENRWQHRDGSVRRIAWSATALVDAQGQTTFIIATGIDVTVQRQAEATLRESEARYRQLVEGSLGMVCTHDLNGKLLSVNTHGAESLGRTMDDMTGNNLRSFMPERFRDGFNALPAADPRDRGSPGPPPASATWTATSASSPTATSSSKFPAQTPTCSASASTSPSRCAPKKSCVRSSTSRTPSSSRSATASTASISRAACTVINPAAGADARLPAQ